MIYNAYIMSVKYDEIWCMFHSASSDLIFQQLGNLVLLVHH